MIWKLRHRATRDELKPQFGSLTEAQDHLTLIGPAFKTLYEAIPLTNDPWQFRILTEGLVAGDLRRIILPQISIDEYVPGDPNTDNVVIAFFIRGVPEAVIPFRDFIMKCKGVVDVAYGDSDTIPDTSIVYAEMVRKDFRYEDLATIMEQIGMLSELEPTDFTMVFPTSTKRFPYDETTINDYFVSRSAQKNWDDQQKAIELADDDTEDENAADAEDEAAEEPTE